MPKRRAASKSKSKPRPKAKPKVKVKVRAKATTKSKVRSKKPRPKHARRRVVKRVTRVTRITINALCKTSPQHAHLSVGRTGGVPNQLQFHTGASQSFTLHMPGGVFDGYPDPFDLTVDSPQWTPAPALTVTAVPPSGEILNYVFENGVNCRVEDDNPPEILIES